MFVLVAILALYVIQNETEGSALVLVYTYDVLNLF